MLGRCPGSGFLASLNKDLTIDLTIDLTKGIKSVHHFVRLTKSVKADLEIWRSFLDDFNGQSIFLSDVWTDSFSLNLYTDAAGSLGFGAVFGCDWFYGGWPEN